MKLQSIAPDGEYQAIKIGERITAADYHLVDHSLVSVPNHAIGTRVGPWDVGLWFRAKQRSQTLYCDPRGSISPTPPPARPRMVFGASGRNPQPVSDDLSRSPVDRLPPSEHPLLQRLLERNRNMPTSHQAAAVTAASLAGDFEDSPTKTDKALTYDDGKAPLAHLPWAGIDAVAMVQLYGHEKYKDFYNYRKGMEVGRNLSCAIRHIRDYMNGHDLDAESGKSHLAHAACRLLFVLQNIADGTAIDDRYSKRKAA